MARVLRTDLVHLNEGERLLYATWAEVYPSLSSMRKIIPRLTILVWFCALGVMSASFHFGYPLLVLAISASAAVLLPVVAIWSVIAGKREARNLRSRAWSSEYLLTNRRIIMTGWPQRDSWAWLSHDRVHTVSLQSSKTDALVKVLVTDTRGWPGNSFEAVMPEGYWSEALRYTREALEARRNTRIDQMMRNQ